MVKQINLRLSQTGKYESAETHPIALTHTLNTHSHTLDTHNTHTHALSTTKPRTEKFKTTLGFETENGNN